MLEQNTIAIACDHAGLKLKSRLKQNLVSQGYEIVDLGCNEKDSVDYPDVAKKITHRLAKDKTIYGILICGSGIGMSIAANRKKHIRAALCHDAKSAELARQHNDANIIVLGARNTKVRVADAIVEKFLTTQFSGDERHKRRINKLSLKVHLAIMGYIISKSLERLPLSTFSKSLQQRSRHDGKITSNKYSKFFQRRPTRAR